MLICEKPLLRGQPSLKGHSQLWDRADLDTTFVSLKSVYLNPKFPVPQVQLLTLFDCLWI